MSLSIGKQKQENDFKLISSYLAKNEFQLWIALHHHRTHTNKQMTLKNHYYLKEVLTDHSRQRVYKKSTQCGISECLIIISWAAAHKGNTVFYVLPTDKLKDRFVSNRFEKSTMFSQFYREQRLGERTQEMIKEINDNKSLKDIGAGVISFAGSFTDTPFVEIPADWLIVDEADKCDPKRLEMAKERLGHASDPHEIYVGNPTYVGSFLDEKFEQSTKEKWNIKADCGHWNQIDFFKHIVEQVDDDTYVIRDKNYDPESGYDINPVCDMCGKTFDRFGYGEFVAERRSAVSGKSISRLFSGTSSLVEIVDNFSQGLLNDYKLERFYNSDLGESFTSEGAKITVEHLDACVEDYRMPEFSKEPCVAGIDVGTVLHVHICRVLDNGRLQSVCIREVMGGYKEIIDLFRSYNVKFFVVDALPETRLSRKLVSNWTGADCFLHATNREFSFNVQTKTITQIRTAFLDNVKENIVSQKLILPQNARSIPNYYDHMISSVRVWNEEKERFIWEHGNKPDHFLFATGYMLLAKRMYLMIK